MSSMERSMRNTTEKFLYSWSGPWTSATEPNLSCRAPECRHKIYPEALNMPERSNDEWREYFLKIAPIVTDAKMTINTYLAVPDARKVVARSSLSGTTVVGPYANEYVWFLTFDEGGEKIVEIEEFIDRKAASDFFERLREAGLR